MKYLLFIVYAIFLICCCEYPQEKIYEVKRFIPDTNWYGQSGTNQTYTLTTPQELAGLALLVEHGNNMNGRTIKLGADISFTSKTRSSDTPPYRWTPIGTSPKMNFMGTFDGDGFVISGIYLYAADEHQGFFGWLGEGAIVKNLGLENILIDGSAKFVGGLAGTNRLATIQNCYTTGKVIGSFHYTGGLVGYNDGGTIINCYSQTSVSGISDVGGLVGINLTASIINSYSSGTVVGDTNTGGLVGSVNPGSSIISSYYNKDNYPQDSTNTKGTAKTVAEMRSPSSFVGWDFTNTWKSGTNLPELLIFDKISVE